MLYAQTSSIKTETQTEKLLAVHFVIMQIPGSFFCFTFGFFIFIFIANGSADIFPCSEFLCLVIIKLMLSCHPLGFKFCLVFSHIFSIRSETWASSPVYWTLIKQRLKAIKIWRHQEDANFYWHLVTSQDLAFTLIFNPSINSFFRASSVMYFKIC